MAKKKESNSMATTEESYRFKATDTWATPYVDCPFSNECSSSPHMCASCKKNRKNKKNYYEPIVEPYIPYIPPYPYEPYYPPYWQPYTTCYDYVIPSIFCDYD